MGRTDSIEEKSKPYKILIIDPHLEFGQQLLFHGQKRGYYVDCCRSVVELGVKGRFRHYDVAVLSLNLGSMAGLELAQYSDRLLRKIPLILVADHSEQVHQITSWPQSAFRCHLRDEKPEVILDSVELAVELVHDHRHNWQDAFKPEQSAS